jgi:hypothetical protein
MRRLPLIIVMLALAGCAAITSPTMAPTPTVDPQAAVDVHVTATVAYLAVS